MIQDIIDGFVRNGLADFEGLEIRGSIPVKQELLNELLAAALRAPTNPAGSDASAPAPPAAPAGAAMIDLLRSLVKTAEIKATDGAFTLNFEMRR
jgi:hypothetical protein